MTEKEKELIKSANFIKQYCDDGYACNNCIFKTGYKICVFKNKRPYEWEVEKLRNEKEGD